MSTNFSNIFRLRRLLSARSKVIFHVFASLLVIFRFVFWEKRWNIVMAKFKNSEKHLRVAADTAGRARSSCDVIGRDLRNVRFETRRGRLRAPRFRVRRPPTFFDWREDVNNNCRSCQLGRRSFRSLPQHVTPARPSRQWAIILFLKLLRSLKSINKTLFCVRFRVMIIIRRTENCSHSSPSTRVVCDSQAEAGELKRWERRRQIQV